MSVTNASPALEIAEHYFNIREEDSRLKCTLKFAGGSAAKLATLNLAAFEFGVSKVAAIILKNKEKVLINYSNEAAETFTQAAASFNKPFAPKQETTRKWLFFKETKTIEGPTLLAILYSGIEQAQRASTAKKMIAGVSLLATAAIALYFFDLNVSLHSPYQNSLLKELSKIEEDWAAATDAMFPTSTKQRIENQVLSSLSGAVHKVEEIVSRTDALLGKVKQADCLSRGDADQLVHRLGTLNREFILTKKAMRTLTTRLQS